MVRTPTVDKNGIRRGAWSEEEDNILKRFVLKHVSPNWRQLPRFAGLSRCGKSCRLRWKNYLNPKIKRGNFTDEEVEKIIKLLQEFGNKWSLIASKLPGRTDNEIKNYWNTHLKNHEKNSENLDQIQGADSMDQVSILMSKSQSIQMKDIDSDTEVSSMNCNSKSLGNLDSMDPIQSMQMKEFDFVATDLFPELSSINRNSTSFGNLDSMDYIQEQQKGILHEPYLLNTSNDLIAQSMDYDLLMSKSQSTQMKDFDFTADDSFSELSSMNCKSTSFENLNSKGSTQEQYERILQEFFLLTTSNDLIAQSIGYDLSMFENQSTQKKEFDFNSSDSFAGLSSMNCNSTNFEILDSMESTQEQYERILNEAFLFNTSNDLTTQSTGYDRSMSKSFDFTAADSFAEVSMDSIPKDFGAIQYEPFLFNISNNKITQSAKISSTEPFLSGSSNSQYLPYNSALSVDSVAGTFETFGNKPFILDTYNSHHLPSLESDCSHSTETLSLSVGSSSANHTILSSTTGMIEKCTAPFMPLETSDAELLNLISVVHSFINSDED